jgi:hypothetical protein
MLPHDVTALVHGSPLPIDGQRFENARAAAAAREPRPGERMLARLRAARLDRELSEGADPDASPQLCARVLALTSTPGRMALAEGLERLVHSAHSPAAGRHVPLQAAPVLSNEPVVEELVSVLRAGTPLYVRGLAMLSRLLSDSSGLAYHSDSGARLAEELQRVRAAFAGHEV